MRFPSVSMFLAALTSRSWCAPHAGQSHDRTDSGKASSLCPQTEQVLLDRKRLHQFGVAGPLDFQLGGQGVGQGVRGGRRGRWLAGRFFGVLQRIGDSRRSEVIENVGVPVSGNVVSQS